MHVSIHGTLSQNHTVERIWVEVNRRINYPSKEILARMVQNGEIFLEDPLYQYCCSRLSLQVANVGTTLFVASWNAHPIPGTYSMRLLDKQSKALIN